MTESQPEPQAPEVHNAAEAYQARSQPYELRGESQYTEPQYTGPRRLYRSADNQLLGGVCEGLSKHIGIDVWLVRLVFVVSCLFAASGALAYAGFWLFVPLEMAPSARTSGASGTGMPGAGGAGPGMESPDLMGPSAAGPAAPQAETPRPDTPRPDVPRPDTPRPDTHSPGIRIQSPEIHSPAIKAAILALLAAGLVVLVGTEVPGLRGHWSALGLLAAIGAGLALLWRQADDEQRVRWLAPARPVRRRDMARAVLGAAIVLGGISALVASDASWTQASRALLGAVALLAGVVLIVLPYLLRVIRDLSAERAERIRSQERAEVAAMMHDSVLHTLTLIQRKSTDPVEVAKLARAQERELRTWLYADRARATGAAGRGESGWAGASAGAGAGGAEAGAAQSFAAAVKEAVAQVEDRHGVPIEVVAVGDAPLDDDLRACVAAAREAAVNAAKYAQGAAITVYAEIEVEAAPQAGDKGTTDKHSAHKASVAEGAAATGLAGDDEGGTGEGAAGSGRVLSAQIYVRDRGPGFDLDAVASDRMGIRESIIGRMARHGGTATIKTAPGEGTEVRLELRRG